MARITCLECDVSMENEVFGSHACSFDNSGRKEVRVVVSSDVIVTQRKDYALLECNGICGSFLLINSKDFGYTSNWLCSGCAVK